jgi:2-furoyl-CoA dehydrogenase 2Fe-2S iron sulfur subunit
MKTPATPPLARDQQHVVRLELNGQPRSGHCEPRKLLSDFLREDLGATGTHVGCEHGVCGACTVQIDGVAGRACMTLAVQAEGRGIRTVEGLCAHDGEMSDLQQAFKRHHALQCGFCTAGILMSCDDYLRRRPDPSEAEVRDMLSGHLCRCTGYTPIVAAVLETAALRLAAAAAPKSQNTSGD